MPDPAHPEDQHNVFSGHDQTLHALVSGRVQGVGFRFFVVREARRLGLTGQVQNLPDHRVEVLARGDRACLQQLVERLNRGPILSRVDRVDVKWGVQVPQATEFTIGY